MSDVILVRQDIEPGKTERAAELFEQIGELRHREAATDVLDKEGVYTESAFLDRSDDGEGDSVLYYIEAADGETVYDVYEDIVGDPQAEAEELADIIEAFRDVVDGEPYVADVEFLYHLPNPTRP